VAELTKYLKKTASRVVAVQLELETDGFTYRKWGGTQTCKAGDWIVNANGEFYTVDRELSFWLEAAGGATGFVCALLCALEPIEAHAQSGPRGGQLPPLPEAAVLASPGHDRQFRGELSRGPRALPRGC